MADKLVSEERKPLETKTVIGIRFADTDMHGHVNNANIATYFEIGRDAIIRESHAISSVEGRSFVLAHYDVRFLKEIKFPGSVDVISTITRVGKSSIGIGQVLYQENTICAQSGSTIVYFNTDLRRSEHLPDWMTTLLKAGVPDVE